MKSIKYHQIIIFRGIFLMTFIFTGCSEFLDTDPISTIGVNSYYKTPQDFNQAVMSAYEGVGAATIHGNGYYFLLTDLRSDNGTDLTEGGGGQGEKSSIDQFEESSENEHLRATYLNSYIAIRRVNDMLFNIETFDMDQTLKNQYIGEVKAIRGYLYFNLVRFFGGVPLVTQPYKNLDETYDIPRSSVDEVYGQIIADLKEAADLLPVSYPANEVGRVTSGAARSLLGTVYLTRKNYAEAISEFEKVINSGQYNLLPDYVKVFDGTNQGNAEVIWAILYKSGGEGIGSSITKWFAPNNSNLLENGRSFGFLLPTYDLETAYESGDIRKDATIEPGYYDDDGDFIPAKYVRYYSEAPVDSRGFSDVDWNIIRYADVLLRYAEALNEQNSGPGPKAYEAINQVRVRAGLNELSGLNYENFMAAVYHEQRVESPFEGHRWFDLIRTGRALEVMNSKISESGDTNTIGIIREIESYQLLYPLPLEVVEVGRNIDQNPGY